jgi:hypothetical protein
MDQVKNKWELFLENHARIRMVVEKVKPYILLVNFITLHYAYFVSITLIGALIFWGASNPAKSIGWWDSMFMVMSAMTATGLNTVNVSQLTTFQQVELVVLMMMGSQILVSYFMVAFRKHMFENRFEDIVDMEKEKQKARKGDIGAVVRMASAMFGLPVMGSFGKDKKSKSISEKLRFTTTAKPGESEMSRHTSMLEEQKEGGLSPGARERGSPLQHIRFLDPIREGDSHKRPFSATTGHSIYNI